MAPAAALFSPLLPGRPLPVKQDIYRYLETNLGLSRPETDEIYALFLRDFHTLAESLSQQEEEPDILKIREITHSLYGFSMNIGAEDLHHAAVALNASAKANDREGCRRGVRLLLTLHDTYQREALTPADAVMEP